MRLKLILSLCCLLPFMTSCARLELASHFGKKLTASKVKSKGKYKVGSPYKIKGKKYYPAVDYGYNKKGMASWYGPNFHGKLTANGERYDQNDLTAAHKTLPLPSIVRVTNLENGRSLIVRVNDRGPYAHGRIIDMSKRSAELLGFKNKGIAKVRVKVLEAESRKIAEIARSGGDTRGLEVPMNKKGYKFGKVTSLPKQAQAVYTSVSPAVAQQAAVSQVSYNQGRTFVQMGAFSSHEAAMKYSSGLTTEYGRAQIYPTIINGSKLYRVRFPTADMASAEALLSNLSYSGYDNAMIVKD